MSKKNKFLSPEEALEAALKEYSSHWHNSAPLLFCAETPDGEPYPQPLNDELQKGNWLIFISSATGPSFSRTLDLLHLFRTRYEELGIKFALILQSSYPILAPVPTRNIFLKHYNVGKIPVCFDPEGQIARAFRCVAYPSQVLIRDGEVISVVSGMTDSAQMEAEVQKQIRLTNPGVPFFKSKEFTAFSWSIANPYRIRVGEDLENEKQKAKVEFIGHWSVGDHVRQTMDPESRIRIEAETGSIHLVAGTVTASMDPTRIYISLNRGGVPAVNAGRDFHPEEDGKSSTQISLPRSYELITGLDKTQKTVVDLTFPNARVNPVAVYGVEFS